MLITSQLTQESLLALSQVCMLFREIAALQYFALLEFNIPCDYNYLRINDGCCRALLVWRRTDVFILPNSICFSVSQTTSDHHFYALRIFFESLTSAIRRMHIHLYSGPYKPTVGFLCLLETIPSDAYSPLQWALQTNCWILVPAGNYPWVWLHTTGLLWNSVARERGANPPFWCHS